MFRSIRSFSGSSRTGGRRALKRAGERSRTTVSFSSPSRGETPFSRGVVAAANAASAAAAALRFSSRARRLASEATGGALGGFLGGFRSVRRRLTPRALSLRGVALLLGAQTRGFARALGGELGGDALFLAAQRVRRRRRAAARAHETRRGNPRPPRPPAAARARRLARPPGAPSAVRRRRRYGCRRRRRCRRLRPARRVGTPASRSRSR